MASLAQQNSSVTQIEKTYVKGESLWMDAWRRLLRNKLALVGLVVILAYTLIAIFAGVIAPAHYGTQSLPDNNGAPQWIIDIFPTMKARDESFRISRGWTAQVATGDSVREGDVLVREDDSEAVLVSNMNGTAFVESGSVVVTPNEVTQLEIPSGWLVQIEDGATVVAGDPLLSSSGSSDVINAPFAGTVYVLEDRILVRPQSAGYVPVRNNFPVGADALGRDMLSRLIYGAQVSLMVAFVGPLVSLLIGIPFGLISGYLGGRVDNILMRFVDIMYAFPTLLLIILLMTFFRSSFGGGGAEPGTLTYTLSQIDASSGGMLFVFIGIGATSWMGLARLARGQVLSTRESEYIIAAESIGARRGSILRAHVLPNILGPIIVAETLTIPTYIRYEAFLSFIGLGVNAPRPSWGAMIAEGGNVMRAYPSQALFPALMLFMIMFAFNFLGDGLRDALDPRLRGVD